MFWWGRREGKVGLESGEEVGRRRGRSGFIERSFIYSLIVILCSGCFPFDVFIGPLKRHWMGVDYIGN